MKKIIPIIAVAAILVGGSLWYFVFREPADPSSIRVEYSPGDFFTTNVKDANRHLRAGVVLVLNKEGLDEMLDAENARIRDTIIFILRDLTAEDVQDLESNEVVRERIMTTLNTRLGIDNIVEVLFNDYVMS